MKYHDIEDFGVTVLSVNDSSDCYFSFNSINVYEKPKKHVIMKFGKGTYDGERKNIILAQNRDNAHIFIQCESKAVETDFHSFALSATGQSIDLVWCKRFNCWFISSTGATLFDNSDFDKWIQNL